MLLSSGGSNPNTVYSTSSYYFCVSYLCGSDEEMRNGHTCCNDYHGYKTISFPYYEAGAGYTLPNWVKNSALQDTSSTPLGLAFGETEDYIYSYGT